MIWAKFGGARAPNEFLPHAFDRQTRATLANSRRRAIRVFAIASDTRASAPHIVRTFFVHISSICAAARRRRSVGRRFEAAGGDFLLSLLLAASTRILHVPMLGEVAACLCPSLVEWRTINRDEESIDQQVFFAILAGADLFIALFSVKIGANNLRL